MEGAVKAGLSRYLAVLGIQRQSQEPGEVALVGGSEPWARYNNDLPMPIASRHSRSTLAKC